MDFKKVMLRAKRFNRFLRRRQASHNQLTKGKSLSQSKKVKEFSGCLMKRERRIKVCPKVWCSYKNERKLLHGEAMVKHQLIRKSQQPRKAANLRLRF